jgi:membrane-associated phospholipid phosphatase
VNPSPRAVLILTAVCFVALAIPAALMGALPGDHASRDWLLAAMTAPAIEALRVINHAGSFRLLLPATLLILLAFRQARRRWWIWIGLMLAAPGAEGLLKIVIGRARPEDASMGFPSGHATAAAAFFGAVIYLAGSLPTAARILVRIGAALVIVLVALARVVLRAHWPSDAVAGIALGLGFASAAALVAELATPADRAAEPSANAT